jgi:hypothetical protein
MRKLLANDHVACASSIADGFLLHIRVTGVRYAHGAMTTVKVGIAKNGSQSFCMIRLPHSMVPETAKRFLPKVGLNRSVRVH